MCKLTASGKLKTVRNTAMRVSIATLALTSSGTNDSYRPPPPPSPPPPPPPLSVSPPAFGPFGPSLSPSSAPSRFSASDPLGSYASGSSRGSSVAGATSTTPASRVPRGRRRLLPPFREATPGRRSARSARSATGPPAEWPTK